MLHEDCAKLSTVELLLAATWRVLSSRVLALAVGVCVGAKWADFGSTFGPFVVLGQALVIGVVFARYVWARSYSRRRVSERSREGL